MTEIVSGHEVAALPAVVAAVAVGLATASGEYAAATLAAIYALLGIGYIPAFGRLGLLSFAQAAFFGLGAYGVALLAAWFGLPFFLAVPAALIAPILLAIILSLSLTRLDAPWFPLVTLAAAHVLWLVATGLEPLRMAAPDLPQPDIALAVIAWVLAVLGALLVWRIAGSTYGALVNIARDNRLAADAAGVDTRRLCTEAFILSAVYGGLAGALFAQSSGTASADAFGLPVMIVCLAATVIGGRRLVGGTIAGAVLVALLPVFLGMSDRWTPLLWSAATLAALALLPDGIFGTLDRVLVRRQPRAPPGALPIPPRKAERIAGPLLAARGITRRFGGIVAVDNVSLALQPGEILGLIGPNGSGKTTLINALSGFSPGSTGRVFMAGRDVTGAAPHAVARAGLARSFQTPQLADRVTALDNVAVSRLARAGAGFASVLAHGRAETMLARARAEAMSCLTAVGLADLAGTMAGDLSSAERRRVEIARALALDPLVVAFDEPSAGLDTAERETLARVLLSLAARGLGLIVVEHDVAFLRGIAQRLACLDAGRLIAIGPTEAVIADPKVAAAYLGAPPASPREQRR
jgi:branched-chain amino acid transport system permease protein